MMIFNLPHKKLRLGLLILIGLLAAAIVPAAVIGRSKYAPSAAPADIGMLCTDGTEAGGVRTFDLETTEGYYAGPDGNQVYMWGLTQAGNSFQTPGPVLCVNQGEVVTVKLTHTGFDPPVQPEPVSLVFPGQTNVTASMVSGTGNTGLFTLEANSGETVQYTFTAGNPGTYLYESGTNPYKQVHMGLFGALVVYPDQTGATGNEKYAYDETTVYDKDREYLILLHEIDPTLHAKVELGEDFDITTRHDRYWTINGRSFPDTVAPNEAAWLPGQPYGGMVVVEASPDENALPALIRYANAGWENHPFHPHGNTMIMVGRDGHKLDQPLENFTTTVGSGQTYDLFFRWVNVDAWEKGGTNELPIVDFPGQLNRVYKDGVTFFSGDAYLGEQASADVFPVGITNYNLCGEFYFPWHSHALHEIQNFDEGFGGMLTLVRVDPPNGCP